MRNEVVIEKMIAYIQKVETYIGDCDYEAFCKNEMLIEACVFNLSQLGELANKIDEEYEKAHSDIPWRQIYGLRNRIIHDYEGINLKLIWEIIKDDLPDLVTQLLSL